MPALLARSPFPTTVHLDPPGDALPFRQAHESESGIVCLAMVLRFHGFPDMRQRLAEVAFRELGQNLHRGTDLLSISSLAEHLGFEVSGYQGEVELLSDIGLPCIALRKDQRFIVVLDVSSRGVAIVDPATGERSEVSTACFTRDWSGVALELLPTDRIHAEIRERSVAVLERPLDRLLRAHAACLIAKGGFASIYCGHRRDACIAIKVIPPYFRNTDNAVRSFRRELHVLRCCAPLRHPHLVRLIDVDESSRALILEWADRGSLADSGALPVTHALRFVRQVADALGALHARGITHRDVTPGNVLLFSGDVAKLCDFGISQTSSDSSRNDVASEYISHVFSSPEQLRREMEAASSDVFSLALTLFFALTGYPLFAPELDSIVLDRRHELFSSTLETKIRAVLRDGPEQVVRARLGANRAEMRGGISTLLGRCLAYDPAARCDAAQLVQELRTLEASSTMCARP